MHSQLTLVGLIVSGVILRFRHGKVSTPGKFAAMDKGRADGDAIQNNHTNKK